MMNFVEPSGKIRPEERLVKSVEWDGLGDGRVSESVKAIDDTDTDCATGLVCFLGLSANEAVPGCLGSGESNMTSALKALQLTTDPSIFLLGHHLWMNRRLWKHSGLNKRRFTHRTR